MGIFSAGFRAARSGVGQVMFGAAAGGIAGAIAAGGDAESRLMGAMQGSVLGGAGVLATRGVFGAVSLKGAAKFASGMRPTTTKVGRIAEMYPTSFLGWRNFQGSMIEQAMKNPAGSAAKKSAMLSVPRTVFGGTLGRLREAAGVLSTPLSGTLGTIAANPGNSMLALGVGGIALAAVPAVKGAANEMGRQQDILSIQRSYQTDPSLLAGMREGFVSPSPVTGVSPSLNDRFMNSTMGLVQGLHSSRLS